MESALQITLLIGVPLLAGLGLLFAGGRILRKSPTPRVAAPSPEDKGDLPATEPQKGTWPAKLGGCLVVLLGLAVTGVGLCFGIVSAVNR